MSRQDILEYLGKDWDRTLALIREQLHSDVSLLEETNSRILAKFGKLLRPMVCLLFARAVSTCTQDSIQYAAATELLHNATLLHDDVADNSAERRGRPTVAALLGPSAAVLVGDFWLARAMDLVVRSERQDRAVPLFSRTFSDLAEGEMLQLEKSATGNTTEADYLRIIHGKTASLFSVAARTGALSADAPPEQEAAAEAFGAAFGTAFQIQDDILDYAGTDALGKPLGVDLREQKITLPLLGALQDSPLEEQIRAQVRDIPAHPEYCERIRTFVLERDGIAYATRRLKEWVARAESALEAFPASPAKTALLEIARYTICRQV